ncbi:uncharacterized protein TM35_001181010 [Trypanosoma theileri]|uniref:Uncharacterized protein n=1 Tax=Trypanosoma theileri TaxID=67003 RepID=A0A1X0NF82_9TRYP|nr:uncharacterized protein TM35_001181010 [Trypanosoma theileri]ORC81413.1 hypothetical protein TM35_001181010 [Trypanosoma theileri]
MGALNIGTPYCKEPHGRLTPSPFAREHTTMMSVYCAHAFITHACLPLLFVCIGSVAHIKNTRVTQSEIEPPNTTRSQEPSGEQTQVKVGRHHPKSRITFTKPEIGNHHHCMGCENTLAGEKERCTSPTVFGMHTRPWGTKPGEKFT